MTTIGPDMPFESGILVSNAYKSKTRWLRGRLSANVLPCVLVKSGFRRTNLLATMRFYVVAEPFLYLHAGSIVVHDPKR